MPDTRALAIQPDKFANFGQLLRYLRQRAGLTQRDLSIAVGYSHSQICRLEKNQRGPDPATLAARFVPALQLQNEPAWTARLLQLAAAPSTVSATQLVASTNPAVITNNLPAQLTSFIGRESELVVVARLLSRSRLVTLTGSGGCGKTRLALQAAERLLSIYPDGVWLVELASVTDAGAVPRMVAAALGVLEEVGSSQLETLVHFLRQKSVLLICDNCEHLIDACARLIADLLKVCPQLRVLATSREALALDGEIAYRVPPMRLPLAEDEPTPEALVQLDGIRLFVERTRTAQPQFILTDKNAPAVAQICRQLDGMPLALELAAARASMLSMDYIAARLNDRFRLLTRGSRSALPRQKTLRATIEWSYDLLSQRERILYRRLAVFMGSWSLAAAETICAGNGIEPAEILDLLTRLTEKSLVNFEEPSGDVRYRLLETVRQFAVEKLEAAGEAEALRNRHLDFFIKTMEPAEFEIIGGQRTEVFTRIHAERDNFRAALNWACGQCTSKARLLAGLMRWYWTMGDCLAEARTWYDRVLSLEGSSESTMDVAMALLGAESNRVWDHGIPADRTPLMKSISIFRELGAAVHVVEGLWMLGYTLGLLGTFDRACEVFESSEALSRRHAPPQMLSPYLSMWGRTLAHAGGDPRLAQRLADEALAIARAPENENSLSFAYMNLGYTNLRVGDFSNAQVYFAESLKWRRQMNTKWLVAGTLLNVALTYRHQGNFIQAQKLAEESLSTSRALGDRIGEADANLFLGIILTQQDKSHEADDCLVASLTIYRDRHFQLGQAMVLSAFSELHRRTGKQILAVQWLALTDTWMKGELPPWYQGEHIERAHSLAALQSQLPVTDFEAAWAKGQTLSLEGTVAQTLA